MKRVLTGIAAALTLILLLVGLPLLLVAVAPIGVPQVEPTLAGLLAALLRPDDGTLFLTLVKAAGWIVWALLALAVGTDIVARVRHVRPPQLPGLAIPQHLARGLIAATLALFLHTGTVQPVPAAADPTVPAPPTTAAPAQPQEDETPAKKQPKPSYERYTVKKGDILSQIALDHLGDARRYPEIFNASRDIRQPGGARLTDPDIIDIGWTLNIPIDKPVKITKKPPKQPTEHDDPQAPTPAPTPPVTATPSPVITAPPTQAPAPQPETQDVDIEQAENSDYQPPWLLAGLAGAGAILAGSLWLALRRRRALQHHHRRPGFVTAPPPSHTVPVEKTLRHQGQPIADLITYIDETLRRAAITILTAQESLPPLIAVEAEPTGLRLHLADSFDLPTPWKPERDGRTWAITTADDPDEIGPLEPDGPPPWPHLVTIGADDTGHWWLLNLDHAGTLAITGNPDYADDLARYLTAELATNPWSRDLEIDLINIFDEVTGLDPRRLHHHASPAGVDDTIAAATETIDRLNQVNVSDAATARTRQAGDAIWASRALITTGAAGGHLPQLTELLGSLPDRTGTSVVVLQPIASHIANLVVRVGADGRARVPVLGLDLIANGITPDEARGCVQLLQAAGQPANTDLPDSDRAQPLSTHADAAGRLHPVLTEPRQPNGNLTGGSNLPHADSAILTTAATTSDDLAVLAPDIPPEVREDIQQADPTLDDDLAAWHSGACDRPRLAVLGSMKVRVGPTGQPADAAGRKPYYTELVAYLASRSNGASTAELCEAFATNPARIHRDLSVVRKWLGADPETREPYLPGAIRTGTHANTGPGVYRLNGLLYDADLFLRLRLRGQTRGTEGLTDYMEALRLVNGIPYTDLHRGGGIWLADTRDDQHVLVAIVDSAHLAVTMALRQGDIEAATRAAATAMAAAPDEEAPKLDRAAAAEAAGQANLHADLVNDLYRQRGIDGPIELGPRTVELVNSHGWGGRASKAS